jgi:beta-lactamase regulating signal transducer with metallopeptidase domain/predicted  nucleic acid-binding Zn-ribbon protein
MIIGSVALLLGKVSLMLALALGAAYGLRKVSAIRLHRLWTVTFGALIALPILAIVLPSVAVPVPSWRMPIVAERAPESPARTTLTQLDALPAASSGGVQSVATNGVGRAWNAPSVRAIAIIIWITGVVAALIALGRAVASAHRLAKSGTVLGSRAWQDACNRAAARLGVTRAVRVVASPDVTTPMAGGAVRPTIFVPAGADRWSNEQRDVVLAHEMAHLASGDPWRLLIARVAFAIYWFHPLVWIASRKASSACEQACDDAVLALGVRPSTYARVLLGFADAVPNRLAALPIARRTSLEARLVSILDNSARFSAPRVTRRSLALAAIVTASLAAATPSVITEPLPAATVVPAAGVVAVTTPAPSPATITVPQSTECAWDASDSRSFSGSISTSRRGGTTVINEQVGTRGGDRVIQKSIGDLRVCAEAINFPDLRSAGRPSEWAASASRVVLETRGPGETRRMTIVRGDHTYAVNGRTVDVDGAALAWRDALFAVLDMTWDISQLRGEVSSKRGEISSILGQRSSLRGEISSLRGQVSSMRGEISSIAGQESSLRGQISSIRGQESSLRGQISSERGAISGLSSRRWDADADTRSRIDERIRRHEEAIASVEAEIRRFDADARVREVEERIARFDADGRAAEVERRLRAFDVEARVAAVDRRIVELDVEPRVAAIEREIEALDADRRVRALEVRLDEAVARLRATIRR